METKAMANGTVAATAESQKSAASIIDEMVDQYLEAEEQETKGRVNVFAECLTGGLVEVTTQQQANEIAKMMNRADADLERVKAMAAAMVSRAEQRVNSLDFLFKTPLQIWTTANLISKKGRSILLEGGKLSLRAVKESTRYVDQAVTLAWAKEKLPAAIEMVPKLKTDVVLEWEATNQQAAPGRELTPAHDSFSVGVPK